MIKPFKKELVKVSDWEFEFQQRGEQPILLSDFYCRGVQDHFAEAFQLDIPRYDYIFTRSSRGYLKSAQKKVLLAKLRAALSDEAYTARILDRSVGVMKEFGALGDEINRKLAKSRMSDADLAAYWEKMDAAMIRLIPWFWPPYYPSAENMITDRVRVGLDRHKAAIEKITDMEDALLALVFPTKTAAFQREQVDFYALVDMAHKDAGFEKSPKFNTDAEAYLKNYSWTKAFLLMPVLPMTREQLMQKVRTAMQDGSVEVFLLQQKTKRENEKKAERLLGTLKGDDTLIEDIELAREFGYVLTAGVEEALRSSAKFLDYLRVVAERIEVPFKSIRFLLSGEILDALKGRTAIARTELERREQGYIMGTIGGEQYALFGKEGAVLSDWFDGELEEKVDADIREFKGQVACKGHARGTVRIALEPASSHALQAGEVLVCPMTNPDYVPAMKRAAAIVTDEGGLLSHAAIMSREFAKPCVIGTKIATKVLKDGDVIDVDAEKGVIHIIR